MPLSIRSDELEQGMRLAEPVAHRGMLLLPAGKALSNEDIAALSRNFPWMSVRIADPILDESVEFQDDSQERAVALKVQSRITQCMAEVHRRHSMRASVGGGEVDFAQAGEAVSAIQVYLNDHPVASALLARCFDASEYLAVHAANVFYLSMLLGSALRRADARNNVCGFRLWRTDELTDLTPLGLGAMFADVGMAPFTHLFGSDRRLSDDERELIRDHPLSGADLLPEGFPKPARTVVRSHHENCNGSGYPGQLPGDLLNIFTHIVRIADAFDSATSSIFPESKSPVRALWEMSVGPTRDYFDPTIMEAFRGVIQPFPIGAKLRLTDGRFAVVVKHNPQRPFDPIVVVAFDSRSQRLRRIDPPASLGELELTIKSFQGEGLAYLKYYGECEAAPLPVKFKTLFQASYP